MTRDELLEALLVERFQPGIPSDRHEVAPNLHELAERRRALIEASEIITREKRTACPTSPSPATPPQTPS